MKKLKLYPVTRIDELAWPEQPEQISLQTPALAFFTDFKKIQPLVIEASATAVETRKMMLNMHVRLNFVLDDNDHLVGVITADDLAERKIVQQVAAGASREEITVSDLMTPKKNLMALGIDEVERATIGDVIKLLKNHHQQHCLVIDREDHRIRGIFSASDISRKLKLPINIQDRSDFYRVFAATA